jgi:hypothetical protein
VTTEQGLENIVKQNDAIIGLLARMIWKPEELVQLLTVGKKRPEGYPAVYNALDGEKTGKQLAELAGVTQQSISALLQTWQDEGYVLNFGTQGLPKYKRLMRVPTPPERRKTNTKQPAKTETPPQEAQGAEESNGTIDGQ